jgi:hypothetical protein
LIVAAPPPYQVVSKAHLRVEGEPQARTKRVADMHLCGRKDVLSTSRIARKEFAIPGLNARLGPTLIRVVGPYGSVGALTVTRDTRISCQRRAVANCFGTI